MLGQAPAGFCAATKCFCTEYEQRVADFVGTVAGPEAMLWDDLGAALAYAPAYTIMGGTSNVMRNILAERILGLPVRRPRCIELDVSRPGRHVTLADPDRRNTISSRAERTTLVAASTRSSAAPTSAPWW